MGAILVVVCGLFFGWMLNRREGERLRQIEAWIGLVRWSAEQVDGFSLPVSEIIGRMDGSLLRTCGFAGEERPCRFDALLAQCSVEDEETAEILRQFACGFGRGYREEQVRECRRYLGALEERRCALSSRLAGRKRINATLSLTGSLAVVLLLL
jgi:hypothetical protein